tara:strand:- start:273 stop:395 length:123 start_codon:yes stop_codon:yes gene_type:complete
MTSLQVNLLPATDNSTRVGAGGKNYEFERNKLKSTRFNSY